MSIEDSVVDDVAPVDAPVDVAPPPEPVAPVAAPATPETPASMDDTIRAKLREMTGTKQPDATLRAPDGKFVKAPTLAAGEPDPAVTPPDEPPVVEPVVEPAAVAPKPGEPDISKPPSSLTAAEKADYDKASPTLKAAFHRREADFHKGLQAQTQMANIGQMMDAEVRPYEAMLRAANLTPQAAVRDLMNTAYQLRSGTPETKTQVILNIAKQYGIDLTNISTAAEALAAQTPAVDPAVVALRQQVDGVQAQLKAEKDAQALREFNALKAETDAFGAKPENKHFGAVKLVMASLIESGQAVDLADAYNKATWADPVVRELLLAEQRAAATKRTAEKAAAAKRAASVNVAPRGTPPVSAAVVGTMEDSIRAHFRKLSTA